MTSNVKRVSPFSATMIGVHEKESDLSKQIFKAEAQEIFKLVQGVHHSRKLPHEQINYSETVHKLSKLQESVPVYLKREDTEIPDKKSVKYKEYHEQMNESIRKEKDLNERKRLYNREVGRTAVVNQVFKGSSENSHFKEMIYPQKATHVQILAMTGSLKAPDANKIPPEVPRNKKWLGDGKGWEK